MSKGISKKRLLMDNDIYDKNKGSNYMTIGKIGLGKTTLMSAIMSNVVTRIKLNGDNDFILPKNMGIKNRGKK
ncbi:hypothetical protein C9426_24070 [Serratia sp. S1B]|nr:hypothetical protein C9426_24070 [Serratia sp. S1B]